MKISIILLLIGILFISSDQNIQLSNSSLKKINKLLAKEFQDQIVSYSFIKKVNNSKDLYAVNSESRQLAYLLISTAKGRYDYFDYCILYKLDLKIQHVSILVYRSDHGFEIMNKKWLAQFKGLKAGESKTFGKDIDAISGATLSATSITKDINEISSMIADIANL